MSTFLLQVMVFDTFEALNASSLSQEPGTAGYVLDTQSLYININSTLGWTPVLVSGKIFLSCYETHSHAICNVATTQGLKFFTCMYYTSNKHLEETVFKRIEGSY